MDILHKSGVDFILFLQIKFSGWDDIMLFISHIGDPKYAFLFLFPIGFYISPKLGIKIHLMASISEWTNIILKWLLHGERPYWWVYEGGFYEVVPKLHQLELSCETGPGSPSGHAMITAAVWYVIILEFIAWTNNKYLHRSVISLVSWSFFLLLLFTIGISRIYIATHFPHQVLLGAAIGFIVGFLVYKIPLDTLKLKHYLLLSLSLFATALSVYYFLKLLGVDLSWSIAKALRRCVKREYVHLDTTPFFSLIRDCSSLIGLGLGLNSHIRALSHQISTIPVMQSICGVLALIFIYLGEFKLPQDDVLIFYCLAFLKHLSIPYFVVAFIPFVISFFYKLKTN